MIQKAEKVFLTLVVWAFRVFGAKEETIPQQERCPTCGQRFRE